MKTTGFIKASFLLLAFIAFGNKLWAQADSSKVAGEWVKSRVWAKGLQITVYSDINSLEFYRQYHKAKDTWDKTLAFLADKAKLDTLKAGMYPIDGKNAYASITDGPEKTPEAANGSRTGNISTCSM
jgi:biofilm protein TabA